MKVCGQFTALTAAEWVQWNVFLCCQRLGNDVL